MAQVNAKYGRDRVAMFYTHISDRYAPCHPRAITAIVRDATYRPTLDPTLMTIAGAGAGTAFAASSWGIV
jgi:hypothetical protein